MARPSCEASIGEWGGRMQDDLLDGVDWAIAEGIAIPDKIAIMGHGYGGYATLMGMAKTPGRFACGVDIVGISNLVTDVNSVPAYWKPHLNWWLRQMGGNTDEAAGREMLQAKLTVNLRPPDHRFPADRTRGQRRARQTVRVRPDRRRDARQ